MHARLLNRSTRTLSTILLVAGLAGTAIAQSTAPAPSDATLVASIDAVVKSRFNADAPGATIIAMRKGQVIYRSAAGLADVATKTPLKPDDVLRIGSVSKQFTSVAILMLADEGKLSVSDEVSKYIPSFPAKVKPVTIEHLLTHTAGIPNFTDLPDYSYARQLPSTREQVLNRFKDLPLEFEPGSRYAYSNSGYFLLGMIIEKVSGKSYPEFLAERIFKPLAMNDSAYEGFERGSKKRVEGFVKANNAYMVAQKVDMSVPFAAGALVSTVDDLARWDAAITAGKLLKPETWKKAHSAYTLNDGKTIPYGYGWSVVKLQGVDAVSHTGGIDGFVSYAIRVPSEQVFVAVLRNVIDGTAEHVDAGNRIAAILIGKPMVERIAVKIDAAKFDQYVGSFQLAPGFVLRVFRDGEQLMAQATGQGANPIFAESEDKFFLRIVNAQIHFGRGADGKVDSLVLFQGGRETKAARLADAPAVAKKEVTVSAAAMASLEGEYEIVPGFVATVFRDGEKLMAQATGQSAFQLFAESETAWFAKVADIKIEFNRESTGAVSSLKLTQTGRDTIAKKIK